MFDKKYVYHYVFAITVIGVAAYFSGKIKDSIDPYESENAAIRQYLLNESPLYGMNRPKLWIHSKYEVNSRQWRDFMSRNTTDLNQPYIHLTIKTIINHCGNDFNICLIDDDTFSKLIPTWDVDVVSMPEPFKSHFRELGLAQLVYLYGGIRVPNSFICMRSLKEIWNHISTNPGTIYTGEFLNHTSNIERKTTNRVTLPSTYLLGANKNCPEMGKFVEFLKQRCRNPHYTSLPTFLGETQHWLLDSIDNGTATLISGKMIGTLTTKGKPVLIDDLMKESYINIDTDTVYGVYIPADEILKRDKMEWFAHIAGSEALRSNTMISKYLTASLSETLNEYTRNQYSSEKAVTTL